MGDCRMLRVPSPNFQSHAVGLPVEASVKVTATGAWPLVGLALKAATGPHRHWQQREAGHNPPATPGGWLGMVRAEW